MSIQLNDVAYIKFLNDVIAENKKTGDCSLQKLIDSVHAIYPELKREIQLKETDKGAWGKIVELLLFGNAPNNDSKPDMPYGDVKTTHFKSLQIPKAYNAKERLTITNFGDPIHQKNIDKIAGKTLQETVYYDKMKKGIVLIFEHKNGSLYNKKVLGIIYYNLDELFLKEPSIEKIFQEDFEKIKACVIGKKCSQKGQTYLHIHPHGSKDSRTRAFGFTNKFLTKIVSIYLDRPLVIKGRSTYIEI